VLRIGRFVSTISGIVLIGASTFTALADEVKAVVVHFKPGLTSASYKGQVKGYNTVEYRLGANAGQTMSVSFETSNASSYFNVLPPGGGQEAIYIGSSEGNDFTGVLPANGTYVVQVYLMRNAARRNEVADYSIRFAIGAGTSAPGDAGVAPGQDFADGNAGGPDFWQVAGVPDGDTLNIRSHPSASSSVVVELGNGAVLRNLGCKETGGQRWCRVRLTGDSDMEGWAAGRYLREGSAPEAEGDALVPGTNYNATGSVDCTFKNNPSVRNCDLGVIRRSDGGATVEIKFPDGFVRVLQFRAGGVTSPGSPNVLSERQGDNTIVSVDGTERFVIPDVAIEGD